MINLTDVISPYLLYIKIGAVVAVVAGIFSGGIWLRGVFAERSELRGQIELLELDKQRAEQRALDAIHQRDEYIKLNREIVDAIKKIKIQSNTVIQRIENDPVPVPPADGGALPFIAPGVPEALPPTDPAGHPADRTGPSAAQG
jgi:hypothetical protein